MSIFDEFDESEYKIALAKIYYKLHLCYQHFDKKRFLELEHELLEIQKLFDHIEGTSNILNSACLIVIAQYYEEIKDRKSAMIRLKEAMRWIEKENSASAKLYFEYISAKLKYLNLDYNGCIDTFKDLLCSLTNVEPTINHIVVSLQLVKAYYQLDQYENGIVLLRGINNIDTYSLLEAEYHLLLAEGLQYTNTGKKCIPYLIDALNVFKEINNTFGVAKTQYLLGEALFNTLDMREGLNYFEKSYQEFFELGLIKRAKEAQLRVLHVLVYLGEIDRVYELNYQFDDIIDQLDSYHQSHGYMTMATLLALEGNLEEAARYTELAIQGIYDLPPIRTAMISQYMISLGLHFFGYEHTLRIYSKIEPLINSNDSIIVNLIQKYMIGSLYAQIPGKNKEATEKLQEVVRHLQIAPVAIAAITDLVESYFHFMYENNTEIYLDEIDLLIDQLEGYAKKSGSHLISTLIIGMKYKLLLTKLQIKEAFKLLLQAIETANQRQVPGFGNIFKKEILGLQESKSNWLQLHTNDLSFVERIETAQVFNIMLQKGGSATSSPEF